jgi:hypothetical protein
MTREGFVEVLIAIGGMVLIVILVPVLLFFLACIVAVLSKAGRWFGRKTKLYDPSLPPVPPTTFERYRAQQQRTATLSRHIPQHKKEEVWWRDGGKCRNCGRQGYGIQIDHVVPFSRGGDHSMNNLQLLCRQCNQRKSNKWVG